MIIAPWDEVDLQDLQLWLSNFRSYTCSFSCPVAWR